MLGEASTTEIARNRDALGFNENTTAAQAGGSVAGDARLDLERKSGRKVSTRDNYLALTQSAAKEQRKQLKDVSKKSGSGRPGRMA
jgi:hypothetical protein